MQKFTVHKGLVAPMDRENVDTDAIIPKQFLKSIKKSGFGPIAVASLPPAPSLRASLLNQARSPSRLCSIKFVQRETTVTPLHLLSLQLACRIHRVD